MTTRLAGFVVTLDHDIREDDAEATIAAIRMLRGVLTVRPVESSIDIHIAEDRARADISVKLWDALKGQR